MAKVKRRVLGPHGMMYKSFEVKPESTVKTTVTKPEVKSEENTDNAMAVITKELVLNMEPQELRIVAKQNDIKLGNVKKKEKLQAIVIEKLGLDKEDELI